MHKKLPFIAFLSLTVLAWSPITTFAQDSFMVRAKSGQMDAARSSVEATGGTVTRTIPQLNVLVVDTDNDNFSSEIGNKIGVEYFTTNPTVSWHEPTQVVELEVILGLACST